MSLEPYKRNEPVRYFLPANRWNPFHPQAELHILPHRQPREQGGIRLLEDDRPILSGPFYFLLTHLDLSGGF
ncbi:hypothetical protein D3C77_648160 [compost metagenome]